MDLNLLIIKRLIKNLKAENGDFSIGGQNDMKSISIFKKGRHIVLRMKVGNDFSEQIFKEIDEEKACILFLQYLARSR